MFERQVTVHELETDRGRATLRREGDQWIMQGTAFNGVIAGTFNTYADAYTATKKILGG